MADEKTPQPMDTQDLLKLLLALRKALTSPEVKAFIEKKYSGAVLPAF